MFRREERHWWYAGMRKTALALLGRALQGEQARSGRPLRLLDAGCGTGGTTMRLRAFGAVYGVDLAWEALLPARERGLGGRLARGSVERLPFRDASFDVVTCFEVLYHLAVAEDRQALAELRRVLLPGGRLLLRVPAHDWLRGEHDRLVHTRHRYTRAELAAKLRGAGFEVERLSWANSLLFPPAAAKRLLERTGGGPRLPAAAGQQPGAQPVGRNLARPGPGGDHVLSPGTSERVARRVEPDLWQPPGPLNALLEAVVGVEALVVPRGIPLPFGLSLLALGRAV